MIEAMTSPSVPCPLRTTRQRTSERDDQILRRVFSAIGLLSIVLLIAVTGSAQEKSLAELMPRIPPKSVAEAVKSFKLERGFSLELVAAEPDVVDPIDAAFDERGRMYVVEMNDYPFLPEQRAAKYVEQRPETWGRIRLLTDSDGDGRMDQSVVFADKLRWPQSVCCARGGVFVIAPPDLRFMKDTDGDGVADHNEVICTGFNNTNVQGLSNGLEWGRDNAIYFAAGMAGGELTIAARGDKPEAKITPGRRDLRIDPATFELTMVSGGQQFGHTIDDWGDRFICSNSNHIVHVTWPLKYLERNPLLAIPDMIRPIAKEGAAAVVFRASSAEPWRLVRTARRAADPEMQKRLPPTELVPIGFFTSATGITVYRGGAYPPEFHGDVFIGDCGGNLVHRKKLKADGISYVAERADLDVEFLTSTDNWFRPVNFVNAPDGTLYVLDMYRETIEHPASIPDDIKALVDLESGYDKGRIWRLTPPNYQRKAPPDLDRSTTADLTAHLRSPHGWVRDTAQRLLVERKDPAAGPLVRKLLPASGTPETSPQTRLQALWTLHGLRQLQPEDVMIALADPHARVREAGLRMVPDLAMLKPELSSTVMKLSHDPSPRVRWQLAFTLGDLPDAIATAGLREMAPLIANQPDLRTAWISSCQGRMSSMAIELVKLNKDVVSPLLVELARLVGSGQELNDKMRVLDASMSKAVPEATRISMLLALGEGLRRRGETLATVMAHPNTSAYLPEVLEVMFQRASNTALDGQANEDDRLSAVKVLALANPKRTDRTLPELLTPQTPLALQQAAIRSLAAHGTDAAFSSILEPWKGYGPATRREVIDNLVQSARGGNALLKAVESSDIKVGEIERDKRQLLMNHPQAAVREAAQKVLAEPPSNRKQVVADYQPALELKGDPERGRMLYSKTCIQCHRFGSSGHQVGPDFASVQNKSPADLLIAILDPNRETQPSFQTYTAVTKQGRIHTGIIASETASSVTLKRAEAKEDVVLRDTLDEFVSNGVSLMPEGLEKDHSPQQIADIIALIKAGP